MRGRGFRTSGWRCSRGLGGGRGALISLDLVNYTKLGICSQFPFFDRITVEPGKCGDKPDSASLFAEYAFLEPEDLQQVLRYAAATVDDERTKH